MKNKKIKRKGYILMIVIIIMFILTSVVISVTMLSTSHSNDIIKDTKKTKAYYLSYAGLEMVYSVLSETKIGSSSGSVNILETAGGGQFSSPRDNIITNTDIEIRNKSNQVLGYASVHADLKKKKFADSKGEKVERWYYRIVATGKINKDNNTGVKDTHTLTMIVFKDDSNNPKVYEGDTDID